MAKALFIQLCDDYNACTDVRPERIISMVNGKAQLNLEYNSCDLCLTCHGDCPTGALNAELPSLTSVYPAFNNNCVRAQGEDCALCQEAFPDQAITLLASGFPQIITEK